MVENLQLVDTVLVVFGQYPNVFIDKYFNKNITETRQGYIFKNHKIICGHEKVIKLGVLTIFSNRKQL